MSDYYWGIFGFPTEDCELTSLNEVSAWAWTGSVGTLNIDKYHFIVGQPDPRHPDHTITEILRVVHSYQDQPETELHIRMSGPVGGSSWEMLRPLAYETLFDATTSFQSEHPWAGPAHTSE